MKNKFLESNPYKYKHIPRWKIKSMAKKAKKTNIDFYNYELTKIN